MRFGQRSGGYKCEDGKVSARGFVRIRSREHALPQYLAVRERSLWGNTTPKQGRRVNTSCGPHVDLIRAFPDGKLRDRVQQRLRKASGPEQDLARLHNESLARTSLVVSSMLLQLTAAAVPITPNHDWSILVRGCAGLWPTFVFHNDMMTTLHAQEIALHFGQTSSAQLCVLLCQQSVSNRPSAISNHVALQRDTSPE